MSSSLNIVAAIHLPPSTSHAHAAESAGIRTSPYARDAHGSAQDHAVAAHIDGMFAHANAGTPQAKVRSHTEQHPVVTVHNPGTTGRGHYFSDSGGDSVNTRRNAGTTGRGHYFSDRGGDSVNTSRKQPKQPVA